MAPLPAALRRLAPAVLRDDVRLRAVAVGFGLIPPRTMHSDQDAAVLRAAADGARRVVEIGVYEGSSALALCRIVDGDAELHLIDPFGHHPDALRPGWGATEWATRRAVDRAAHQLRGPRVVWHVALAEQVAQGWSQDVDLVFIDGDHSESGCDLDWRCWSRFVVPGGAVVFHDARHGLPGGRGLPGPTAVVNRLFRRGHTPGWEIFGESDRTVAVRRLASCAAQPASGTAPEASVVGGRGPAGNGAGGSGGDGASGSAESERHR